MQHSHLTHSNSIRTDHLHFRFLPPLPNGLGRLMGRSCSFSLDGICGSGRHHHYGDPGLGSGKSFLAALLATLSALTIMLLWSPKGRRGTVLRITFSANWSSVRLQSLFIDWLDVSLTSGPINMTVTIQTGAVTTIFAMLVFLCFIFIHKLVGIKSSKVILIATANYLNLIFASL